jgi:putative oxidoreductase
VSALFRIVCNARGDSANVLVRLLVGPVFLSEGIQKFLYPAALGVGRFQKIGIPLPDFSAPFVGAVEIVAGTLLVLGLLTRLATVLLLADIAVAIATTKLPMLAEKGFWATAHEARTDWSMALGLIFLLVTGAGARSFDARIRPRST